MATTTSFSLPTPLLSLSPQVLKGLLTLLKPASLPYISLFSPPPRHQTTTDDDREDTPRPPCHPHHHRWADIPHHERPRQQATSNKTARQQRYSPGNILIELNPASTLWLLPISYVPSPFPRSLSLGHSLSLNYNLYVLRLLAILSLPLTTYHHITHNPFHNIRPNSE